MSYGITLRLSADSVDDMLIMASERACRYWCKFKKWKKENRKLVVLVVQTLDEDKQYQLTDRKVSIGLHLMSQNYVKIFARMIQGDIDDDVADVFLQLCLFGKIVYS